MSLPVLVDRSWYVQEAQAGRDPLQGLAFMAETREVATCGLIRAEVGRQLGAPQVLACFRAAWDAMLYIPSDVERWDKTLELGHLLRRRGIDLPLLELHVATCALSIGAVVLTYEPLFQKIPGLSATDRIY